MGGVSGAPLGLAEDDEQLGDLGGVAANVEAEERLRAFLTRGAGFNGCRGLYPDDSGVWVGIPVLGRIILGHGEPGQPSRPLGLVGTTS